MGHHKGCYKNAEQNTERKTERKTDGKRNGKRTETERNGTEFKIYHFKMVLFVWYCSHGKNIEVFKLKKLTRSFLLSLCTNLSGHINASYNGCVGSASIYSVRNSNFKKTKYWYIHHTIHVNNIITIAEKAPFPKWRRYVTVNRRHKQQFHRKGFWVNCLFSLEICVLKMANSASENSN